ncbi:MAG: CFI-box-CTERM domain-containing protein [Dehalococcoidia bacterium]
MASKKYCVIALLVIMAMVLSAGSLITVADEPSSGLHTGWMMESYESGTYNRTYEYYIPSSYTGSKAVPLLFSFHGLGSNGEGQIYLTNFTALAEQEGFIAVFPDSTALDASNPDFSECAQYLSPLPGSNIMWNIGLIWTLQYCAGIDDVGFVSDIIDWFEAHYKIDTSHIYSTGMSNGAMFAYYVALMLPGTFAGIAAVCSPMTVNGFGFEDVPPLTVITMQSPTDPIVQYNGVADAWGSMDDTIAFWRDVDDTTTGPATTVWSDDAIDTTTVTRYVYSGGKNGTKVILYKIEGGGHTWPGGPQYAPASAVGLVSNQIDASAEIWENLSPIQYHLTISSTTGGLVNKPGNGTFTYYEGTAVDLVAVAEEGYQFVNWTGDVDTITDVNATATNITMNGDCAITANFKTAGKTGPCFIATAAYGTPMAEEIQVLREFRDEYLLTNPVGKAFVDFYYKVSPPIAEFITEHPSLKPIVRAVLMPIVAMSTVAVNTTPTEKMAIVGVLALVSAALAIWATRRRGRGPKYT